MIFYQKNYLIDGCNSIFSYTFTNEVDRLDAGLMARTQEFFIIATSIIT